MRIRQQLAALHEKYERLLALHRQKPERSPARRQSMVEVAARFPGALREWQALPIETLEERRAALATWLSAPSLPSDLRQLPPWVAYSWDLHAWLRLVLSLRQQPRILPEAEGLAAAQRMCDELGEPQLRSAVTPQLLAQVNKPSRGQLAQIAYVQVAAQHGVAVSDIKASLFSAAPDGPDDREPADDSDEDRR
ncbi:MAG TPA: hypothetical protein PKI03_01850 [Pseudomonadota bacterium]|nr:hypothetical protein [Pseudomonadota bacterium]